MRRAWLTDNRNMGRSRSVVVRALLLATAVMASTVALLLLPGLALATFPGANGQIAFDDGRTGGITAMNPGGTDRHRITRIARDGSPSYSSDGTKIVFVCRYNHNVRICTVNADGSHRRRLFSRHLWGLDPAFSPNGRRIVFAGGRAHRRYYSNIWVMRSDGGHRHVLKRTCENDWNPSFSPDGNQIVFERVHCGDDISVAVMNADGSGLHDLTTHPNDGFSAWPDFSPDGSQIVYGRFSPNYHLGVWLMNADGSGQHELTPRWTPWSTSPVFSPNGQKIAFDNGARKHTGIYVMNEDGANIHRLPNSSPHDAAPSWGIATAASSINSPHVFSQDRTFNAPAHPPRQTGLRERQRQERMAASARATA
jgi:Tol biopolymer transport system component